MWKRLSNPVFFGTGIVFLFFSFWVLIGLNHYKDFGISWDEDFARELNGKKALDYMNGINKEDYLQCSERYHGPVFEIFLYKLDKIFKWKESQKIFYYRHLTTYLFYLLSAFCFYILCRKLFESVFIGLFATSLFLMCPKLFSDSFYNSKDSVNVAFMTLSLFSLHLFLLKPKIKSAVVHGIISGMFVSVRITGIIVSLTTLAAGFIKELFFPEKKFTSKYWINNFVFIVIACASIILTWPVLWIGPIEQFSIAWKEMSNFSWISTTLYLGEYVWSNKLPWHYVLGWIALSLPTFYLFLFLSGVVLLIWDFIRRPVKSDFRFLFVLLALFLFITPIVAVIYLNSVVYDGWRHLYFIYPCFVLVAAYTVFRILEIAGKHKKITTVLLCVPFIFVAYDMIRLHPYQHLYLNSLYYSNLGEARFNMEMDYWGLTYKEGLTWIAKNDSRQKIKVIADNYPGELNALILDKQDRWRITFVKQSEDADYFIGNYRWRRSEYEMENEVYSIVVDKAKVLSVYKLK